MSKQAPAIDMEEIVVESMDERTAPPIRNAERKAQVELPSRKLLPDGSPNPDYDPTLDPGAGAWQAERFFNLREQVRVHIRGDQKNPSISTVGLSINGYYKEWPVETEQIVPIDFAELLMERKIGWRIS